MSLNATIPATCVALCIALGACGEDEEVGNPRSQLSVAEARAEIEGAPAELAALREQANELLGGGGDAFAARLRELRGRPVVINKWASWCGPCRAEFPYFQSQATERAREVAFLGVDSNDAEDAAATFLRELPLPYPSYLDPDQEIADEFMDGAREFPATAFYGRDGQLSFVHLGVYSSEDELAADIERHAR